MPLVHHRFRNHVVAPDTQILIIGTFNPDVPNGPDFYYGRARNHLWQLLPGCWNEPSLKGNLLADKLAFCVEKKIDFCDLITTVNVPNGQEHNVNDEFIDDQVEVWFNTIVLIDSLKKLEAVYFTRKTFARIPHILQRITAVSEHCARKSIRFSLLPTPARYPSDEKQQQWKNIIVNQNLTLNIP